MRKIVLVTGGFDPIHSGHIAYFREAALLGDMLFVGVNSDEWLTRKKGKPFLPFDERAAIVEAIKGVDAVISFDDSDGSAKDAIRGVRRFLAVTQAEHKLLFGNDGISPYDYHIVFANGGDRTKENIPEMSVDDPNISFVFGVGGENKKNSSSWILNNWENKN